MDDVLLIDPSISCSAEEESAASAGGAGWSTSPSLVPDILLHVIQLDFVNTSLCGAQEADRNILAALLEGQQVDRRMESARRERAVADAAWMKRVIEEQLHLEQEREAEFDILHR